MAVQIVVSYKDGRVGYFPVPPSQSWRVDSADRCLVIGTGVPRVFVPLDSVVAYEVENVREPCACPRGFEACRNPADPDQVYCKACREHCRKNDSPPPTATGVSVAPQPG